MSRFSRRIRRLAPEIEYEQKKCLFCLQTEQEGFNVLSGVLRLPCCKKFVHGSCQARWEEENIYCGHCRQELLEEDVVHDIRDPIRRGAVYTVEDRLEDPNNIETEQVSVTYKIFKFISNICFFAKHCLPLC